MAKIPRKAVGSTSFPFVRQFTAPPFFVDIEDAKRKSQLLLDAVQHTPTRKEKPSAQSKVVKSRKKKATSAKKSGRAGKV